MIFTFKNLTSRSASRENPLAKIGGGGTAGNGVKGSPAIKDFKNGTTEVLLETEGSGIIRHIWMSPHARSPRHLRNLILRMYWEGSEYPSVEAPISDFFGVAHGAAVPMYSKFISIQEGRGFNCYFPMPFSKSARITITNETGDDIDWFFYQIDFTSGDEVTDMDGRFHSFFHRENPCPLGKDFIILETSGGHGIYMGCVLGIRSLTPGWWGEGEVKMYIDNDNEFPTICGTGTEDYIGSAWGLGEHCTPYQGAPLFRENFASIYRLHEPDPIYFRKKIKVTIQQMGCGLKSELIQKYGDNLVFTPKNHPRRDPEDGFYLRSDDYCATAFWYQYPLSKQKRTFATYEQRTQDLYCESNVSAIANL